MKQDDLLDFLKSNPDKKFRSDQLGKWFGMTTATMTMRLNALGSQIENETNGHKRLWWYMSDEVRQAKQERLAALEAKKSRMTGAYKPPQNMIDAYDREREGRNSDFGFITIS